MVDIIKYVQVMHLLTYLYFTFYKTLSLWMLLPSSIGLFLYEATLSGAEQGDAHVTQNLGKSIDPIKSGLEWER